MRRSSTYLILIILIGVAAVVANRYYHYISQRDFLLDVDVACDPSTEHCFIADCSPEEDPNCDTSPYKYVEILARNAPSCLEEHACDSFSCDPNDATCSITYCDEDTVSEGEQCTPDPSSTVQTESMPTDGS